MTKEQQQQFFDDTTKKMKAVLLEKGDDYANEDRLSNFKMSGAISGTGKDGRLACLQLIATKVARLGNLFNVNGFPKNESISDSILDLSNYSVILSMLQSEWENTLEKVKEQDAQVEYPLDVSNSIDLMSSLSKNDIHVNGEVCAKESATILGFFEGVNYKIVNVEQGAITLFGHNGTCKLSYDELNEMFTTPSKDTFGAVQLMESWTKTSMHGKTLRAKEDIQRVYPVLVMVKKGQEFRITGKPLAYTSAEIINIENGRKYFFFLATLASKFELITP